MILKSFKERKIWKNFTKDKELKKKENNVKFIKWDKKLMLEKNYFTNKTRKESWIKNFIL